jgi:hypothetical protein
MWSNPAGSPYVVPEQFSGPVAAGARKPKRLKAPTTL